MIIEPRRRIKPIPHADMSDEELDAAMVHLAGIVAVEARRAQRIHPAGSPRTDEILGSDHETHRNHRTWLPRRSTTT